MMQEPLEQQVTLNDYLRVLYRGRWIIAIAFLATVLATAYFTFTTEPIYEASATVMVKEEGSGVSDMLFGGVASAFRRETEINNQVQILKSRTLAEAVIRRLQQSPYADKLRILGNVPEDVRRSFNPVSAAMGLVSGLFRGRNQQTAQPSGDELVSVLAEDLQKRIKISPVRDTDMIHIKFDAPSPFEAAYVTNAIAQTYREQNIEESRAEVKQVKEFLEGQLPAIKKQLESAEERLKQYQEKRGVYALDKETEKLVEQISEAEALYQEALTDLQSNEKRLAYVDSLLAASKTNIDVETIASEPYLEEIRKQIAQLEIARSDYISSLIENGVYRKDDPKLQEYDRRLEQLNKKFQEEVAKIAAAEMPNPLAVSSDVFKSKIEIEAELRSLRPRVKALKAIRDHYRQRLESVPAKALELARLKREALVNEKIYTMMQEKYEESRITEVGQLGKVRIVDPARPPRYPVKPKKKLNLMLAAIIGLMLGVGIAFVIEYMDNSIRSPEEVERMGLPLLGTIPVIAEEEEDGSRNNGRLRLRPGSANGDDEAQQLSRRLVAHFRPKSPISEAYRTIRTNIQYSRADDPIRSLLITSPGPGEGKSTTAANLAITFAQLGYKTLLVDADLRRPVMHRVFGLDRNKGLTNCLVGREQLESVVNSTEIENLFVLTCGPLPPNPSEMLGSEAMKRLLSEASQKFEAVVLDSPPVLAVTDAAVMSTETDGTVLVVRAGKTDRQATVRAHESLRKVGAHVLGGLLNGVRVENLYGSYYYYYHYYYYTRDGEKKVRKRKKKRSHY